MAKGVSLRPKLSPPQGRQLERSYRPYLTCFMVSTCIAVLMCVVFGLTAFNIYNHRFGRTERKFHAGDQISLWRAAGDLTPVFCSAYSVDTRQVADFYLLPKRAEVDPFRRNNFTMIMTTPPGGQPYVKDVHYLPEGSVASLSACRGSPADVEKPHTDVPAEFLVIVGDEDFDEWRKYFNNRHVKHRVVIPKNATCKNSTTLPHLELSVSGADNYFFVLIMRDHSLVSNEIRLTGVVSSTVYNVSGATSMCNHSQSTCEFPLAWGSKQDIIAQVLNNSKVTSVADAAKTFVTDCQVRLAFWVPLFGVVPFCLMGVVSVWCWYLLVKKRSISSRYRQPARSRQSGPSYGSMDVEESAPLIGESPPPASRAASNENENDGCASIQD
ncbi:uncharacterized protein [Littorina saxatilis]|uniref:E3 ubiquitin-protein ligase APD1-4 middle domain-containing protein n=1 Tax=Littorina saxatilis TaxID=31220 RepID=A0AAN9G1H4_9CAEN